jgi:hypothetical protein
VISMRAGPAPAGYASNFMGSTQHHRQVAREIAQLLHSRTQLRPRIAMLLGSGHASIANQLKEKVVLHGDDRCSSACSKAFPSPWPTHRWRPTTA